VNEIVCIEGFEDVARHQGAIITMVLILLEIGEFGLPDIHACYLLSLEAGIRETVMGGGRQERDREAM
jgi:hypothetical protein